MKLYVAAKWEDRERAREVMRQMVAEGHEITFDWTHSEQFSPEQAACDMRGVKDADALVFVAEKDLPFKGAYVEMGMALAWGKPIYLIGTGIDACIFTVLPNVYRGIGPLLASVEAPTPVM